ncbi:M56 family metallopeptidase [Paenibacillus eucommiae]|uniref:Beta-lactamase regulating signal transducer with metallopeptidase domain n=1 Tax=Paenibacillus eucommiae TaxID=1355755 RepID=A0ABS4IXJ5_9BACL|nr:M56 family metallopeptidase [Paenibacillus eucommiae]MBP1991616.1 beta-lactamase regulating signal transducer with metallopeptidase domain [Paenibacillus eucommiae]
MMVEFYYSVLLMSTVAAILYIVLRVCIKWTQKHFTATWIYYLHVLLSIFFLIPFYKLFAYLDIDFMQTANRSLEISPVVKPLSTLVQGSFTFPLNIQEGSYSAIYAAIHESSFAASLLVGLLPYMLAAGTFIFIAVIVLRSIKFHRRMSQICELAEDPLILNELAACKQKMGITKEIPVYLSPYVSTPFLYGIFKPRIVLAAAMEFSSEEYHQIMMHELTHYKRHDILLKCLLLFIHALHWFNPFAYLARRDIDRYCELSCDEKIVRFMNEDERKRYCELLLNVLWNAANQKEELVSAFSGKRKYLERRISMIWRSEGHKSKKSGKSVRVFAAAILLSFACMSTAFAYIGSHNESAQMGGKPQASASKAGTYVPDEDTILEGEVGTTIRKGDLIFERMESDSRLFSEHSAGNLAGNQLTHLIKDSEMDEYCTIWIRNAGSGHIIFTITKDSPTGTVVPGSIVRIPAHTTWTISTLKTLKAGDYYTNFTSGSSDMSGRAAYTLTLTKE